MAALMDGLGWVGAVALLAAYAMLSFGRLSARSATYQGLNIFGSILLTINTGFHGAYPSAAVNVIWIAIAIMSRMRADSSPATPDCSLNTTAATQGADASTLNAPPEASIWKSAPLELPCSPNHSE